MHTYDPLAHRKFTFSLFLDDYAFHDEVRPDLNATLAAQGIADHSLLSPQTSRPRSRNATAHLSGATRARFLPKLDPGYHIAALRSDLPWSRTFETSIDVGIAPDL